MILTITLHPSIDRTVELGAALEIGGVARAHDRATEEPAGKGVNVTRTLLAAGTASTAIVVADAHDRLVASLEALDVPTRAVAVHAPVRQNLAIVDPDTRQRCSDGRIGEIWVTGPNVSAGYWKRPDETAHS